MAIELDQPELEGDLDLQELLRSIGWDANKRTLPPAPRLASEQYAEAQALHRRGAYEACIRYVMGCANWQSDPRAWRLVGLCQTGLKNHDEADKAHDRQIFLDGIVEVAKGFVNKSGNAIDARRFEAALRWAERARRMAPFPPVLTGAYVCILSVLNLSGRRDELVKTLKELLTNNREVADDPEFLKSLADDTDLIGITEILVQLKETMP